MNPGDLENSLVATNNLLLRLAERAENDSDEADRLKSLLRMISSNIVGVQFSLPSWFEDYCDNPRQEMWEKLKFHLDHIFEVAGIILRIIEKEEGDFIVEEHSTYMDLVESLNARWALINETKQMSFPPSERELERLRAITVEYTILYKSLRAQQEDLASYIKRRRIDGNKFANQTQNATEVILLVHGIRDFALWQSSIRAKLEAAGYIVETTNYGRLNVLSFLFPFDWFRKHAITAVTKQIKMAYLAHPGKKISVIAHSFGTYVIACILRDEFEVRFHRVIFCGSVVPHDFPFEKSWEKFSHPILNEVGTDDVWPAIAESLIPGFGSAGTYGFRRTLLRDRWHNDADHGFFLDAAFAAEFWLPFLESGKIVDGDTDPTKPRWWLQLFSIVKIKYVVAFLMVCGLIVTIWGTLQ